jgi:hypothetical protein
MFGMVLLCIKIDVESGICIKKYVSTENKKRKI